MRGVLVVSDSSTLIGLSQIRKLELLKSLFGSLLVPPAVAEEIKQEFRLPDWLIQRSLSQPVNAVALSTSLGPGESEAISLALEVRAGRVILDDRPARRLAQHLGLPVIGTLGILLESKRRGFPHAVRPCLDDLLRNDFRISRQLCDQLLRDAGE